MIDQKQIKLSLTKDFLPDYELFSELVNEDDGFIGLLEERKAKDKGIKKHLRIESMKIRYAISSWLKVNKMDILHKRLERLKEKKNE